MKLTDVAGKLNELKNGWDFDMQDEGDGNSVTLDGKHLG
jgi:hypothetical protein